MHLLLHSCATVLLIGIYAEEVCPSMEFHNG